MRNLLIIASILAASLVLGATVFRSDIAQATGLAQAVTVNNTSAQPVPVHEQNVEGGNVRVHEEGTAAVRNVNDGQNVYAGSATCTMPVRTFGCDLDPSPALPSGKRLVVETVSERIRVPVGTVLSSASVAAFTSSGEHRVWLTPVKYGSTTDTDLYAVTQQLRMYVTAPDRIACGVSFRPMLTDEATMECSVDGYLVDVP